MTRGSDAAAEATFVTHQHFRHFVRSTIGHWQASASRRGVWRSRCAPAPRKGSESVFARPPIGLCGPRAQLRDLIGIDAEDPERHFFYPCGYVVNKFRLCDQEIQQALALDFCPTCLHVGHGFLAAGSQTGQLVVKDLRSDLRAVIFEPESAPSHVRCSLRFWGSVGASVINAIHIYDHFGETRLLTSTNDADVKGTPFFHPALRQRPPPVTGPWPPAVFRIRDMERLEEIPCGVPVNYAAVSPDRRFLAVTGDSRDVSLFDLRRDGYRKTAVFSEGKDHGMSVAWSSSSRYLASASQDGLVAVWDVRRSEEPVARLRSASLSPFGAVPPPQGAWARPPARSVKFAPAGAVDLLLFTEHTARVLSVGPQHGYGDSHIAGACFTPDGHRIYALTEASMFEYAVDSLQRRAFPEGALA
eukprot:tig00000480_g1307.t1